MVNLLAKYNRSLFLCPFQFGITFTKTKTSISNMPFVVNDTNDIFGTIWYGLHPADDIHSILNKSRVLINSSRIDIKLEDTNLSYPPKVADYSRDCNAFQVIANSALEVYNDGKIIPGPMGGPNYDMMTDAGRHYWNLTENIYRFSPILMTKKDISMHHGMDEKISVENYNQVSQINHIMFVFQYMQ